MSDKEIRVLEKEYEASGYSDFDIGSRLFQAKARIGEIDNASIELLARLGHIRAVDYYYEMGGKKLQSKSLTLSFIKTIDQLTLIRIVGAMFEVVAESINVSSKSNYLGKSRKEIQMSFQRLAKLLLTESLGFRFPQEVLAFFQDMYNQFYNDYEHTDRSIVSEIISDFFRTPNEWAINARNGFSFIFDPKRTLNAPDTAFRLYNRLAEADASNKDLILEKVMALILSGKLSVKEIDRRRRRWTPERGLVSPDEHEKEELEGTFASNYVKTRSSEMVYDQGKWVLASSLKAKSLSSSEEILKEIAKIFKEHPVKIYKPFEQRKYYNYYDGSNNSRPQIISIYIVLGRNISNNQKNSSIKAQDAGFLGAKKLAMLTAWTGLTKNEDLITIKSLLKNVPGVEKVVIDYSMAEWTCPECEQQVYRFLDKEIKWRAHRINDKRCLESKERHRKYLRYFGDRVNPFYGPL